MLRRDSGISARQARLVAVLAHVVIFVLSFQVLALDHRHGTIADAGLHASHCHGAASGCADSPSLSGTLIEAPLTIGLHGWDRAGTPASEPVPEGAVVATPHRPPRV